MTTTTTTPDAAYARRWRAPAAAFALIAAGWALWAAPALAFDPAFAPAPGPFSLADEPTPDVLPGVEAAMTMPSHFVPVPRSSPGPMIATTAAVRVDAKELSCLATAVYFEARGESLEGQKAVAEVVIRRSQDRSGYFPTTLCGVIAEGATGRGRACQFSFMCDGSSRQARDRDAWETAMQVARYELSEQGRQEDVTRGATHFHTTAVRPGWRKRLQRTVEIGDHIFYRYPGASTTAAR